MEVLRPAIVRIGSRCYRKNYVSDETSSSYDDEQHTGFVEEDLYDDEACDSCVYVEETNEGFRLSLDIPASLMGYIVGKKGETRKRIEEETNTRVRIPKQGEEGLVVISGGVRSGVLSARTRINLLADTARGKQPFTHFLSIPVNSAAIVDTFLTFQQDVLKSCKRDRGIDGSIFQTPRKLHLTLGTLVLLTESDVIRATELLGECKQDLTQQFVEDSPLTASFEGLEYMNDDPSEVDVLYGKVQLLDGSDRLQSLVDALVARFLASGLMPQQFDTVKLHVTLINSLFRSDSGTNKHQEVAPRQGRESFDATNILKRYSAYHFGEQAIDSVHLSQRYSTGDDGYYMCTANIALS